MELTNYERETIINFNQAEPTANVYTYNPQLIRRLDDLSSRNESVVLIRRTEAMREYEIPKGWVKINPPRQMTEENKEKARERMRALRSDKNVND